MNHCVTIISSVDGIGGETLTPSHLDFVEILYDLAEVWSDFCVWNTINCTPGTLGLNCLLCCKLSGKVWSEEVRKRPGEINCSCWPDNELPVQCGAGVTIPITPDSYCSTCESFLQPSNCSGSIRWQGILVSMGQYVDSRETMCFTPLYYSKLRPAATLMLHNSEKHSGWCVWFVFIIVPSTIHCKVDSSRVHDSVFLQWL